MARPGKLREWQKALAALCASCLLQGCAVRFTDPRAGTEHLWGLGTLQLQSQPAGNGLVSVTSGSRVPGLCLTLGREQFGLAIGLTAHQRLAVVATNEHAFTQTVLFQNGLTLARTTNSVFGFGHLSLKLPPASRSHHALITGQTLAGLGTHLGGCSSISLGLDRWQRFTVLNQDTHLEIADESNTGSRFDLFNLRVVAPSSTNISQIHIRP